MLVQVARDREPAAPGERPVRERRFRIAGLDLERVPQGQDLMREVQPDLFEPRDGADPRVAQDERAGGIRHRIRPCGRLSQPR